MPERDVVIVGGGITGLTAAYLAARAGRSVTLVEGSPCAGGLLETFELGGTRLEFYYHHFFTHDAEILWLVRELGIADRLEFHPGTMGVLRDGRIFDFNGPRDLLGFAPLSLVDKARFALSSAWLGKLVRWQEVEDVAALDWFYRHAGRAATEALWRPLLEIKFGPYAPVVPAAWMAGRLRQRMNSRRNGDERLGYLTGSLHVLLEALLGALRRLGVEVVTGAPVRRIVAAGSRIEGIETPVGSYRGSQHLFTIPTLHLAPLVEPLDAAYAAQLRRIEYFGAVCTILELDRPLSEIYWLNVADPGFPFGGVIEHTNLVPAAGYGGSHVVYLSRYFERTHELATMPTEAIGELMTAALPRIYPDFDPRWIRSRHVFRTLTAATVCDLGFSKRVPACRMPLAGGFLATMAHVYPDERSCNNSIRVAAEACRVMGIAADVPRGQSLSGQIGMEAARHGA